MVQFYGTNEVRRQEQKLTYTFGLVKEANIDSELSSIYARFLCIRLAGFAEQSLKDLISAHARKQSSRPVHKFVESKVNMVWGINKTKLREVLDSFDPEWYSALELSMAQELDSLHSVGKLRDNISHGGDGGVTLQTMTHYRDDVYRLTNKLCEMLDPV